MKLIDNLIIFILTGGYAGKSPKAPGTMGTVVAVLIAFLFIQEGTQYLWAATAAVLGVVLTNIALERKLFGEGEQKDPQSIVLDEIAGYFVALINSPLNSQTLIFAFILFRLFDITKPYPIKRIEKLPRGWGITLDDLMAGVFACIVMQLINSVR